MARISTTPEEQKSRARTYAQSGNWAARVSDQIMLFGVGGVSVAFRASMPWGSCWIPECCVPVDGSREGGSDDADACPTEYQAARGSRSESCGDGEAAAGLVRERGRARERGD